MPSENAATSNRSHHQAFQMEALAMDDSKFYDDDGRVKRTGTRKTNYNLIHPIIN